MGRFQIQNLRNEKLIFGSKRIDQSRIAVDSMYKARMTHWTEDDSSSWDGTQSPSAMAHDHRQIDEPPWGDGYVTYHMWLSELFGLSRFGQNERRFSVGVRRSDRQSLVAWSKVYDRVYLDRPDPLTPGSYTGHWAKILGWTVQFKPQVPFLFNLSWTQNKKKIKWWLGLVNVM